MWEKKKESFEHGIFTLKTHQMFSVHTTPEYFENAKSCNNHQKFWIGQENHMFMFMDFKKFRFQNVVRPYEFVKPLFSNSSGLQSDFEKLRFRDG